MRLHSLAGGLAALCLLPAVGWAQPAPGNQTTSVVSNNADLAGSFDIDTTIPTAPGFSVIGLSPTDVIDPAVSRVTFASLINYLDKDHHLKPGAALGGSPYWWFKDTDLQTYRTGTSWAERVIARTEVSAGYAHDSGGPQQVGVGFTTELLDSGDYRFSQALYDCVAAAHDAAYGSGPPGGLSPSQLHVLAVAEYAKPPAARETFNDLSLQPNPLVPEAAWEGQWVADKQRALTAADADRPSTSYVDSVKKCQTAFAARRRSLIVAGGIAFRSNAPGGAADGGAVWTSYRQPIRLSSDLPTPNYLVLFGRYDFGQHPPTTVPAATQTYDKGVVAVILGYEAKSWKLSFQGGYEWVNYHGIGPLQDDRYAFYSVNYNLNLAKNVWVEVLAGKRRDRVSVAARKDSYALVNVHWAPDLVFGK